MKVSIRNIVFTAVLAGCAAVQATPLADFNGSFEAREDGLSPSRGWSIEVNTSGGAVATGTVDSTSGTAKDGKNFYHIAVTAVSEENWHIQLKDPTWAAVKGSVYHMSMWVRSDSIRPAQISVYGGPAGKNDYRTSSGITLSTEWQQFDQIFTADTAGNGVINFALVCGFQVGTYDIDGVVIDEAIPDGIYTNGGFEAKGAGWNLWVSSDSDGGAATMTFPSTGAYEGTYFGRVAVTEAAGEDYKIQLQDGTWASELNTEYILTFFAKADHPASITVAAQAGSSRDYAYISSQNIALTTDWYDFTFDFIPDDTLLLGGPDSISFVFYLGDTVGVYDFDDVKLIAGETGTRHAKAHTAAPAQQLTIRVADKNLVCTTGQRALKPFTVDLFNIQGQRFNSYTIAPQASSFTLPCPPTGTWVVKSGTAKKTVIVP